MQRQLELLNLSLRKRHSAYFVGICGVAFAVIGLGIQGAINAFLPSPYLFVFVPAAIGAAWFGGFACAIIAIGLCVLGANFTFYDPKMTFGFHSFAETVALGSVTLASAISSWSIAKLKEREWFSKLSQIELEMTLRSIGDAVVVVDNFKNVAFLNPVAEKLTGWTLKEARGRAMDEVFKIINEETRAPAINPVDKVFREGTVVGLANHTVLISRDGTERPIEDSAAPIQVPLSDELSGVVLVFRDVSEKVATEGRVKESEARLKLALASSKMGTFYIDLGTNQVTRSPELSRILGLDSGSGELFESIDKVVHPEDRERTKRAWHKAINNKAPYENESRIIRPDGEIRWILSRGIVMYDPAGKPTAITGVTVDINDLKRTEEKLRASERRFATLFSSAPQATALSRLPEGIIVDVNPAFEELLEYKRDEVVGRTSRDLRMHPNPSRRKEMYDEVMQKGRLSDIEIEIRTKSGKIITVANSVRVVDLAGEPHALTSLLDLTKIKLAEKALREKEQAELRESEKLFRELVNALPQMAWEADTTGHFYWYNDRWYDYTGTSFEEMQGRGWQKVHHPDFLDRVNMWWSRVREVGESSEMEFPLLGRNGVYRWFLTRVVPIKDDSGTVVKWCGTNTDIQAQKTFESDLSNSKDMAEKARAEAEEARHEAERANQLKSAFLANMSHEIRTPLGAMIGFADLLKDPGLSQSERSNYTEILTRNGENLSVIINDILDLSKVEAGHLTLEFSDISPCQIVEDVVSLLRVKAKDKNLDLELVCESDTPETIVSDSTRVRQILLNILGNAIKFTPYGSVKIRSFAGKSESNARTVCFEVTDTGIGIPPSQKDRVFEMFVQADGSMTRRFGGTGLGLALSKRLSLALGGNVEITKTEPGQGSTFLITIEDQPIRRNVDARSIGEKRSEPVLSKNALVGLRILVVDDAPDNRQLIWHYLTKQGAVVESAENGQVGFKMALAGDYHLVLMDIQMPEMDGYTATHKLRSVGYGKPIIALTAHAMSDVRQKCLNVGCNGHLTKPIDPNQLISFISQRVSQS